MGDDAGRDVRTRSPARLQAFVRFAPALAGTQGQPQPSDPFKFVNNSGSPVVDRSGPLVGIIFDGNIQSPVLDYTYAGKEARAIGSFPTSIISAVRDVYHASWLLNQLLGVSGTG